MNSIKARRLAAGLTLEQVAKATQLHITVLSKIENEKRHLRVAELPIFARALGCSIHDLLHTEEEHTIHVA